MNKRCIAGLLSISACFTLDSKNFKADTKITAFNTIFPTIPYVSTQSIYAKGIVLHKQVDSGLLEP